MRKQNNMMITGNKQLTQERNFDEVEFISGYVMRLIKLTEQNIQLAKQERENNVHRQIQSRNKRY